MLIGTADAGVSVEEGTPLTEGGEEMPAGEPTEVGTIKSSRFIESLSMNSWSAELRN